MARHGVEDMKGAGEGKSIFSRKYTATKGIEAMRVLAISTTPQLRPTPAVSEARSVMLHNPFQSDVSEARSTTAAFATADITMVDTATIPVFIRPGHTDMAAPGDMPMTTEVDAVVVDY